MKSDDDEAGPARAEEPHDGAEGRSVDLDGPGGSGSPYGNLFVPLVVVPALIVVVLVLVFVLFGAIGSSETDLREDLDRMLRGGAKEQQHAAYALVQKLAANVQAEEAGLAQPFPVTPELAPEVEAAWRTGDHSPWKRYVLASLSAQLDSRAGVPKLIELLKMGEAEDPNARIRFDTLFSLAALGDERAFEPVAAFLEHPDPGLRLVATLAMQRMPPERARERVLGGLEDNALDVRLTAAVTLAKLGDASGAELLRDGAEPELYAADARDRGSPWLPEQVMRSRRMALGALALLGREQDRELVARLAREADDLMVRDAAKRALEAW